MPNHCENYVSITGQKAEIERLWEIIKEDNPHEESAKLTRLYPMPDELGNSPSIFYGDPVKQAEQLLIEADMLAKYGHKDWYSWALANWGTKWGDYDYMSASLNVIDTWETAEISLSFHTAWGPFDEKFWEKVSADFPTLKFSIAYEEPGMVFCGAETYRNGERVFERYIDDYNQIIGEPNWYDDDDVDRWYEAKSNLRDRLFEQAENA